MTEAKERKKSTGEPAKSDVVNQPNKDFAFLEKIFGAQKYSRALQPPWFERWTWLHYDAEKDNVVCFICVKAMEHNLVQRTYRRDTAVTQEFCSIRQIVHTCER